MVITQNGQWGSIGGGNLEYQAAASARVMIESEAQARSGVRLENRLYGLGPALQQCCGGAVSVLFEYLEAPAAGWLHRLCDLTPGHAIRLLSRLEGDTVLKQVFGPDDAMRGFDMLPEQALPCVLELQSGSHFLERIEFEQVKLVIFGAGHVARALVPMLSQHAFDISWIDSRPGQFAGCDWPGTETIVAENPRDRVADFAKGTLYLVMTHSHELDEELCFEILSRNDAGWLGLIGSMSKRKRFEHRLRKRGLSEARLAGLTCPVGMAGITGKRPATIALSICAQLVQEKIPAEWR